MEQFLEVKYKLKSSTDNFESYLKFINVGFLSRKAALSVSPVATLTKDGDVFTLTMVTTLKTIRLVFKLDEEFEEERADGVKVRSKVSLDDNTLVQTQIEDSGRKSTFRRIFTPESLTVLTTAEGFEGTVTRIYERV